MKVLDLFSGIGGFSLGLERAGFETVAFCEIDPYCQKVLRKHWPHVPIHDDIRTLKGDEFGPVDVVCGGFPCQAHSSAARGRNLPDKDLWPEMCRVIRTARPAWVIGENVANIGDVAFRQVVSGLEDSGFKVTPLGIPACAVGLDHWRLRYWFLGYADKSGKSSLSVNAEASWMQKSRGFPGSLGETDGVSTRVDRLRALGNSVIPQIPEIIGRAIKDA